MQKIPLCAIDFNPWRNYNIYNLFAEEKRMELKYNRIVAFGDSNTYGYDCRSFPDCRLPEEQIWTDRLSKALGCEVINCGLNGRRVPRNEQELSIEIPVITRHLPFDAVTVMLGVNDVYNFVPVELAADNMRRFIEALKKSVSDSRIILIAPPLVRSPGNFELRELSDCYEKIASELETDFVRFPAGAIRAGFDGIHFSADGHAVLAELLSERIKEIFGV